MTWQELFSQPEFFDLFGLPIFVFITVLSGWMLKTGKKPKRWSLQLLLIIGVLGIIVDGSIVAITKLLFMGG